MCAFLFLFLLEFVAAFDYVEVQSSVANRCYNAVTPAVVFLKDNGKLTAVY